MAKTKKIYRLIYTTRRGEVISILLDSPYMELTLHLIDEVPEFTMEAGISKASRDIIKTSYAWRQRWNYIIVQFR